MWFIENRIVFPAQTAKDYWQLPEHPEIVDVTFSSEDGNTIHGWFLPCPGSSDALILCHGNGGNLSYRSGSLVRLRHYLNCSVLIFDYPGYGKSSGRPSEQGCYDSAEAAWKWLTETKGFVEDRILIFGDSLGGGVGTELARKHPYRALILVKTFTSLPAIGKKRFPWLPVSWLMRNRFDNFSKIKECHHPIFIASASNDHVVPYEHGPELFEAANDPKYFLRLEGQDHNEHLPEEFYTRLKEFLKEVEK
jgi:uncharacterized protein